MDGPGGEIWAVGAFAVLAGLFVAYRIGKARGSGKGDGGERVRDLEGRLADLGREMENQEARVHRAVRGEMLEKARLTAHANHQLRQPVQALSLQLFTLREELKALGRPLPESAAETFEDIRTTFARLSDLLNLLLEISRLEAGAITPETTAFRAGRVFRRAADLHTARADEKDVVLDVVPCSALLSGDPKLLERLLSVLIANAVEFTDRGRVLIGGRRRGGELEIQVVDTGFGIEPGDLERIFEPFERVELAERPSPPGSGLGLTLARRLAELMNYRIAVRSQPDVGSVFSVFVPRE